MACAGPATGAIGPSLAAVLRAAIKSSPPALPREHWRILNALLVCRTPVLGWHRYLCRDCGRTHFAPHSCRNRHCPVCQGVAAHQWLRQQEATLLPVPYFHVVFTLPHRLNALIQQNQQGLYSLLFAAATETLLEFGQNRFGIQLGITAVLHTWSQTLLDHYHLHCIVTGGGLSADGRRWVAASPQYLFAVRALAQVFRGKFCAGLEQLYAESRLQFHGQLAPLREPLAWRRLLREAVRHKWVVYAKRPFAGPRQVLAYLSRYTHRVALSPRRLLALDEPTQSVTLAWKDYADGGKRKTMPLELKEFVRRFCLHLLPPRFVKIRHFGFLSNRQRKACVAQARALLGTAVLPEKSTPSLPVPVPVCPHCGSTLLLLVDIVPRLPRVVLRPLDSSRKPVSFQ